MPREKKGLFEKGGMDFLYFP